MYKTVIVIEISTLLPVADLEMRLRRSLGHLATLDAPKVSIRVEEVPEK